MDKTSLDIIIDDIRELRKDVKEIRKETSSLKIKIATFGSLFGFLAAFLKSKFNL